MLAIAVGSVDGWKVVALFSLKLDKSSKHPQVYLFQKASHVGLTKETDSDLAFGRNQITRGVLRVVCHAFEVVL
jgi:hypothetical protein